MAAWLVWALAAGLIGSAAERTGPPVGAVVDPAGTVRRQAGPAPGRWACVVFLRDGCPVAELHAATLAELVDRFGPRGVAFLGVDVGDEPGEHPWPFPTARDPRGELAGRLGASRTPEAVVLDESGAIRYRGRVDDQYAVGSRRPEPRRSDLAEALADLVAGRPVRVSEAEAVGCPIERPGAKPGPEPDDAAPTYARDVAAILDRRCVGCHRPGEVGPFSLTTHAEAAGRALAVAEAVGSGRMPPWRADPRFGHFRNDARLTDPERATLLAWVEAGCPEGDPADRPAPIARPSGWRIDEPDLVVAMPRPFRVPAQGVVDYQHFEVDPGFAEDRWVQAAEIRPGNRRVVHHATVFLKAPGSPGALDAAGELGSYCLATTTPGGVPMTLPPGSAKRIPAGWRLVFVVHYAPIGTPEEDRSSIGLKLVAPAAVRREVATNLLYAPDLVIPPHAADHRVERSHRFDRDAVLLALFPHMHYRGRSFRFEVSYPDGRIETLLHVPRWDINWQDRYELAEPLRLPAGSTLRAVAHYDNSAANPANPDPGATVLAGPQSTDEMFNGYFDFALADGGVARPDHSRATRAVACLVAATAAAGLLLVRRSAGAA